jgi:glycosyltransferase involved in cell wall biosynthesis
MAESPKIIFVVNEDWAFMTLRLPMAKAALAFCKSGGGEVIIATRVNEHRAAMEGMGFRVVHVPFERGGINPFKELSVVWQLARLFRAERPDIIHTIALKANLDGSLAALAVPKAAVINTFTGMGAVFIGSSGFGLVRKFLISAFCLLMGRNKAHVIVQNKDDLVLLLELGIARAERSVLIAGSGVNMLEFPHTPEPAGTPVVTMVARLLWDKGIGELVSTAKLLKERGCAVKIQVVGSPDPQNPQSVDEETLQNWKNEGIVDFLGYRTDIATIWAGSHIAILPSYREGLPKSLLEAASCGKPLIATDVPGCRELVKDGENGLLVPVKNTVLLADAIEKLVNDLDLRSQLGDRARVDVEMRYADTVVIDAMCKLYKNLLK